MVKRNIHYKKKKKKKKKTLKKVKYTLKLLVDHRQRSSTRVHV